MLYIVGSEYGETQLQPTILVWFGFLRNETESNTEGFVGTHNPGDVEEKYVVLFFLVNSLKEEEIAIGLDEVNGESMA